MCGAIIKLQALLMLFHWPHAARLSLLFTALISVGFLPRKVILVTFHVWVLYLNPNSCLLDLFAVTVCTPPCKRQVIITCAVLCPFVAVLCVCLLQSHCSAASFQVFLLLFYTYFCFSSLQVFLLQLFLGMFLLHCTVYIFPALSCAFLSCTVLSCPVL